MKAELIIRILTITSLAGLLLAVGLRLTFEEVANALKKSRFALTLIVNFAVVPILCALAARWADLESETATAMVLLGAAPFAPVVPVFARLVKADMALAAGLTSIYPVLCAFLTPWVCGLLLKPAGVSGVQFSSAQIMFVLVATITLPLLIGVALNQLWPGVAKSWLRIVEVISEAAGACSLAYVTFTEFHFIRDISWKALFVMAIIFEISLAIGYALGREKRCRRVVALGTSNRNIALALLVALQSFSEERIVAGVVGNGLLLILLGLVHVGYWNLRDHLPKPLRAATS